MNPSVADLLRSPVFWFSTVIVGIIVGIIGNFATGALSRLWSHFSETQKQRWAEREASFDAAVQDLSQKPSRVTDIRIEKMNLLLGCSVRLLLYMFITNVVYAVPLGFLTSLFALFISIFAVSVALSTLKRDQYLRRLLKAYEQRIGKPSVP